MTPFSSASGCFIVAVSVQASYGFYCAHSSTPYVSGPSYMTYGVYNMSFTVLKECNVDVYATATQASTSGTVTLGGQTFTMRFKRDTDGKLNSTPVHLSVGDVITMYYGAGSVYGEVVISLA